MRLLELGGTGPPLLLLHANGFHHAVFEPMVASCFHGFRCLGVDLPGHGDAQERGTRCAAIAPTIGLLTDTLERAGLRGRCLAFGHSLGGALALAAEVASPGLFAAIYAYEPVAGPAGDPTGRSMAATRVLAAMARRRRAEFGSLREAAERLGSKPPFSGFHPAALAGFLRHGLAPRGSGGSSGGSGSSGAHSSSNSSSTSAGTNSSCGAAACGAPAPAAGQQQQQQQATWALKCEPEVEAAWYEAVGTCVDVDAPRVGCPVVIAVGGSGGGDGGNGGGDGGNGKGKGGAGGGDGNIHGTLPALGARLASRLPNGALRRFGGLRHFGPLEAPAEVGGDARAFFLGALAAAAGGGGAVSGSGGDGGGAESSALVMSRL